MDSKKKAKDAYWLAICADARKLLGIIWYMLKKGFQWECIQPIPEVIETVKKVVTKKIKLFQSKLKRYCQIWERLSGQCEEVFEVIHFTSNNPRLLLKTLVNSI